MKKFEYKQEKINCIKLIEHLNKLGEEGWELIKLSNAYKQSENNNWYKDAYFKRNK